MKVTFSDKFYNANMVGRSKDLPADVAKALIKLGEAYEAIEEKEVEVKKQRTKKNAN
jgi:hypothetical protein